MTTRSRRLTASLVVVLVVVALGAGAVSIGNGWWPPSAGPASVAAAVESPPAAASGDSNASSPAAPSEAGTDPASPSAASQPATTSATESPSAASAARPRDRVDRAWPKRPPWDACPAPVWPGVLSTGEPGQGRRVLVVGDSLTRESRRATARLVRASGWTPTFRCWGSKRLDWGLAQLRRAKQLDQLPDYVVMALGTNDISWESRATNEQRVREVLRVLGKKRQVLWLDVDTTFSDYSIAAADWFNAMIRRVASDHPNVTVVPWKRTARSAGVKRWDGIHYGSDGYRLRARTIAQALDTRARKVEAVNSSPAVSPSPSPSVNVMTGSAGQAPAGE